MFEFNFLDDPREDGAISYRVRDINRLRRILVARRSSQFLVSISSCIPVHPNGALRTKAFGGHTLRWVILPRSAQDFISEILLTLHEAFAGDAHGAGMWF